MSLMILGGAALLTVVLAALLRRKIGAALIRAAILGVLLFVAGRMIGWLDETPASIMMVSGAAALAGVLAAPRRAQPLPPPVGPGFVDVPVADHIPVVLSDEDEMAFREWLRGHNLSLAEMTASNADELRRQFAGGAQPG
jgi:hypothetical protein